MRRTKIEQATHTLSDTLRWTIVIIGFLFVGASIMIEQPWRHLDTLYTKAFSEGTRSK